MFASATNQAVSSIRWAPLEIICTLRTHGKTPNCHHEGGLHEELEPVESHGEWYVRGSESQASLERIDRDLFLRIIRKTAFRSVNAYEEGSGKKGAS
jgi:hypothetical protein